MSVASIIRRDIAMIIKIQCPNPQCGSQYNVPEEQLGQKAVCKKCGRKFLLTVEGILSKDDGSQKSPPVVQPIPSKPNDSHDTPPPPPVTYDLRRPVEETKVLPAKPPANGPVTRLGRFEIRGEALGAGAFGAVYRGYDPVLGREVALKIPHRERLQTDRDKERFLREAKAAAQLRHPNIVPIYEAGVDGDTYYIASAFIEGRTLHDAMEMEKFDFRRSAKIVMDLAGALQYAHDHGVVHRDIKPANIMLDNSGDPLVMDFGLARLEESSAGGAGDTGQGAGPASPLLNLPMAKPKPGDSKLTQDGTVLGTPAYMSPEQAMARHDLVGPVSDQYSLGVVLYELLCGQTPFSGPPGLVLSMVINQSPPLLCSVNSKIPLDLEAICKKAMSKRRDRRYTDCNLFAEDLRRWSNDEAIQARRIGRLESFRRWRRRNPVVAALSAGALILLLVVAMVTTVAYIRTSHALATADDALKRETAERERAESEKQRAEIALKKEAESKRKETEARRKETEARQQSETERQRADKSDELVQEKEKQAEVEKNRAEEQFLRTRTASYGAQLALAQQHINEGEYEAARDVLNACPRDLRLGMPVSIQSNSTKERIDIARARQQRSQRDLQPKWEADCISQ